MARLGKIIDGGWPVSDLSKRPADWRTQDLKDWKFRQKLARRIRIRLQIQRLENQLDGIN